MTSPAVRQAAIDAVAAAVNPAAATGDSALIAAVKNTLVIAQAVPAVTPPTATANESPDGATATAGSGAITDSHGQVWTVRGSLYLGLNGVGVALDPAIYSLILWKNHKLYGKRQENGRWYEIDVSSHATTLIVSDPRGAQSQPAQPPSPPMGTIAPSPSAAITINSLATLNSKRANLIQAIWNGAGVPTERPGSIVTSSSQPSGYSITGITRTDHWITQTHYVNASVSDYMDANAYVFRPTSPNGKAALIMGGHNDALNVHSFDTMTQALVNQGVTVVVMPMVGFEAAAWRNGAFSPGITGHDTMGAVSRGGNWFNVTEVLIRPAIIFINQLVFEGFTFIGFLGFSGGGWAMAHIAAVMGSTLNVSYDVSGSEPLEAPNVIGRDWEQSNTPNGISYQDLYILGACRTIVGAPTKYVHCLNAHDVYFPNANPAWFSAVKGICGALGGDYRMNLYDTGATIHELDSTTKALFESEFA